MVKYLPLLIVLLAACEQAPKADLVLLHGNIYTLDESKPRVQALAIKDGNIIWTGSDQEASEWIGEGVEVLDISGQTVIPGFIESHGHLLGLGQMKRELDLSQVASYEELVAKVAEATRQAPEGQWIVGRGWHQSKWTPQPPMVMGYQTHEALSAVSPAHPVYLVHASGHSIMANAKAMEMAGIGPDSKVGGDGEILRYPDGKPTGIFTEMAMGLVGQHIPAQTADSRRLDLQAAITECLAQGITSFQDAGSDSADIAVYREFQNQGRLGIRLWVMLAGSDSALLASWYARGPETGDYLTVRAIKLYADGALGSRGAWLLEDYSDRPGHRGNALMPASYIYRIAREGLENGFQVCTHAIGDRANRTVLDAYETAFKDFPEAARDARFRVEHAQHLHPDDIPRFAELGVIASIQGIHMSSDRPWAIDRLGEKRIVEGAYVWQKLLQSGAKVINGTDVPVEPENPVACFYASVTRKTLAGTPEGGYEADQRMTREQALRTYTLDAAYGAFEDKVKGSIVPGKYADLTILDQDIMTVPESQILATKVTYTIVGGKIEYRR